MTMIFPSLETYAENRRWLYRDPPPEKKPADPKPTKKDEGTER